jgi:hypothetical protein
VRTAGTCICMHVHVLLGGERCDPLTVLRLIVCLLCILFESGPSAGNATSAIPARKCRHLLPAHAQPARVDSHRDPQRDYRQGTQSPSVHSPDLPWRRATGQDTLSAAHGNTLCENRRYLSLRNTSWVCCRRQCQWTARRANGLPSRVQLLAPTRRCHLPKPSAGCPNHFQAVLQEQPPRWMVWYAFVWL